MARPLLSVGGVTVPWKRTGDVARILLVDGDADTREILRVALENRGHVVLDAADGASGLRLAREHQPALIIGDFPMDVPGESPFTGAVRRAPELQETRILTVTARAMSDDLSAARRVSDAVLVKPVEPRDVVAEVERLLGGGTGSRLP